MPLPVVTFLRLKRSAEDAALDELSVVVPTAKRRSIAQSTLDSKNEFAKNSDASSAKSTNEAPHAVHAALIPNSAARPAEKTLRFRRLAPEKALRKPGHQLGARAERKFIDLHMSAVVGGPTSEPTLTRNGAAMARTSEFVYDIFEPIQDDAERANEVVPVGWRIACIDWEPLFVDLLNESEEGGDFDDPSYSDGDERSIDYPSTPECSEDGLGESSADEDSDIGSSEDDESNWLVRRHPVGAYVPAHRSFR